jgi:hypothetical protein
MGEATKRGAHAALVLVGLLVLGAGCSKRAMDYEAAPASISMAAPLPQAGGQSGGAASPVPAADRAMRITVETTIEVTHRDTAVAALRSLVSTFGGYVGEGALSGPDKGGSATFTVKVPAVAITDFRGKLAALGEVKSDSEKAEDVTESRADIRARLHNSRAEEQRFLDLLANHTGNLGDVVLVEKEIASVRESIERMEAEERTLEGQIAFATVKVFLTTEYVPADDTPGRQIYLSAKSGIQTARGFLLGTVTFLLAAGPTLLILAAMLYGVLVLFRTWLRRRKRSVPVSPPVSPPVTPAQ